MEYSNDDSEACTCELCQDESWIIEQLEAGNFKRRSPSDYKKILHTPVTRFLNGVTFYFTDEEEAAEKFDVAPEEYARKNSV